MAEQNTPQPTKQPLKLQLKNLRLSRKTWLRILLGIVGVAVVVAIVVVAVVSNTREASVEKILGGTEASTTTGQTTTTVAPEENAVGATENISDGTYLVGTDIPAGVYKGTVTGGSGYWQISSDANGLDIVAEEDVSEQFYLEVKEGQFLKLRHVTISLQD